MKKHNRQGKSRFTLKPFICTHCKNENCEECVDIMRVVANLEEICKCSLPNHSGEPAGNQVRDPFDGSVHAPGLVVSEDGEVVNQPQVFDWTCPACGMRMPSTQENCPVCGGRGLNELEDESDE